MDNNKFLRGQRRKLNLYEDNNMSTEEINKVIEPYINKNYKSIHKDNIELFKSEYYCKWQPSKEYEEAYKLWLWYNYHCEKYDSIICTGKNEYEDYMPITYDEHKLVNSNASRNLKYINRKRTELLKRGVVITESDWLDAKKHFCRYKLKALEEEYKYYFKS